MTDIEGSRHIMCFPMPWKFDESAPDTYAQFLTRHGPSGVQRKVVHAAWCHLWNFVHLCINSAHSHSMISTGSEMAIKIWCYSVIKLLLYELIKGWKYDSI